MKTARKVLLLVLCAALLVSASVMGTLAYLTDDDAVVNTFTVGAVAITLDELDTDNDNNVADNTTYGEGEAATVRDKANDYKLYPGHTYVKDPTIHVGADSEDCWLFVKVENGIAAIEADTKIADQMADIGWSAVEGEENLYAYKQIVSKNTDVVVFNSFKIAETVTNDTLASYADAVINVTAYAVQTDGFDTAAEAWAAAEAEVTAP